MSGCAADGVSSRMQMGGQTATWAHAPGYIFVTTCRSFNLSGVSNIYTERYISEIVLREEPLRHMWNVSGQRSTFMRSWSCVHLREAISNMLCHWSITWYAWSSQEHGAILISEVLYTFQTKIQHLSNYIVAVKLLNNKCVWRKTCYFYVGLLLIAANLPAPKQGLQSTCSDWSNWFERDTKSYIHHGAISRSCAWLWCKSHQQLISVTISSIMFLTLVLKPSNINAFSLHHCARQNCWLSCKVPPDRNPDWISSSCIVPKFTLSLGCIQCTYSIATGQPFPRNRMENKIRQLVTPESKNARLRL